MGLVLEPPWNIAQKIRSAAYGGFSLPSSELIAATTGGLYDFTTKIMNLPASV